MSAKNPIDFNDYIGGEEVLKSAARSLRSLKNDSASLSKSVDEDSTRIKAGFDRITAAVKELQEKGGKLNLFSDADKKLLAEYVTQIGSLKKAKDDLKATEKAQADLQRGLSDATKQYTTELARQKDALRAAAAAGDAEGQKKAAAAIRATAQETAQLSKALRGANSEFTAAKGSYDALVIENNKLLASLHGLEGGLLSGSQEAAKLKKQIFDNTETLKIFDLETNRAFRNVGNYAQSFQGLIAELAKARAGQAGLTQGSEEYNRQQMRITGFQTAAQKAAANMGLSYEQAEAKINGVTSALQPLASNLVRLEREQDALAASTGRETEAYRRIGFQIESTRKELNDVATATVTATEKSGDFTQQLGFNRAGLAQFAAGLITGAVGFQAILSGIQSVFEANVMLSDSLADVRKTTGLTADETDRLVTSLKQLDTRTSLAGLLDIAKVGGQLGIAKNDILEFTKAVDIGVQALGDDFTGGAEEIATTLGKLSDVFKKELGPDVAQNLLSIGSAVNEIGAEGAATAPFLTDVALRVGAVASQANVGLKNVLAYAAVLQETGFGAEVAGTGLNKLFNTLSTKTVETYRIAQNANPALTLKEFTRLVNTDFNAAIQLFLKGLNAGGKTTTALAGELATLKLKGGEAQSVIVALAQNTDLFAERQKTANDQLRDATSLSAEAAIKNDTLAGSWAKLTNGVGNFFTSGTAGRALKWFIDVARETAGATLGTSGFNGEIAKAADRTRAIQENYTITIVENTQALEKQAKAQQRLLDSYTELASGANRTEGERLELARVRARLIAQFGTDEAGAIQSGINKQLQAAESYKVVLRQNLASYDKSTADLLAKNATYQEALTKQEQGLSAAQIARAKQVAQARFDAETRTGKPFQVAGNSTAPELEPAIAANARLLQTEKDLATQQRTRANILGALQKLGAIEAKSKQDQADATEAESAAEAELDRAAKARSDNRRADLQAELAENQRRIDALKKYAAEQGKLFEDRQLTNDAYGAAVAGSQDAIIAAERRGAALRIRIAREETTGKLVEVENERIRLGGKKNITAAELNDIEAAAGAKRVGLFQKQAREIEQINRDLQQKLEVAPIEFRPPLDNIQLKKDLDKADDLIKKGIAQTEKQVDDAGKRQQKKIDDAVHAVEVAENRKQFFVQQGFEFANTAANAYFNYQQGKLDALAAAEDARYQHDIAQAGDNAELKTKIEEEHQKQVAAIRRKQAVAEREQALLSVAFNTAQAVTSVLSTGGGTRYADFGVSAATLTALVVAQGLAQAAAILATPIPEFFKGRRGGEPVPLASVAERGPEIQHQKSTGKFIYHAKPSLTSLGRGDDVYTAEETRKMMAGAHNDILALQQPLGFGRGLEASTAAMQAGRSEMGNRQLTGIQQTMQEAVSAMKNLKQVTLNVNGEVQDAIVQRGDSLTRSLNQRLLNYGR